MMTGDIKEPVLCVYVVKGGGFFVQFMGLNLKNIMIGNCKLKKDLHRALMS